MIIKKKKYQKDGYNTSYDTIGKSGIEAIFESNLRGKHGSNIIKVDNNGTKKEDIMQIDPIPGDNIYLTIDKKLQKVTERALNDVMTELQNTGNGHGTGLDTSNATRGAVVVIDVNNGDILSLVSLPNYDPNVFVSDENMTPDIRKQYFATDLKNLEKNI